MLITGETIAHYLQIYLRLKFPLGSVTENNVSAAKLKEL